MMTPTVQTNRTRQRGSALIVAFVFLIVLTLLGLSSMNTARMEVRMANNTQFADQAYQAAESAIDAVLGSGSTLAKLETPKPGEIATGRIDPDDLALEFKAVGKSKAAQTASTEIRYMNEGLLPGFSDRSAHYYQIDSTGRVAGAAGEAAHVQGFYMVGATE